MIDDATLESALASADDFTLVAEFYAAASAPPFDPGDALLRYASGTVTFAEEEYEARVKGFGRVRRTITAEANTAQLELSNLDQVISDYAITDGFEGLIMVIRLISRSRPTTAASLIIFTGRCDRPESGNRESVTVTARQVTGAVEGEVPRRKYSYNDADGRHFSDPNFEGFRFVPQYGTSTYSVRERRGGLLGLLGFKKTVTRTLQYSSYSDIDQEKYVPEAFGRVQMIGTHVAYADIGTEVRFTDAFCEGPIEDYSGWRTDDTRFTITGTTHKRLGYPPGQGPTPYEQVPIPGVTPDWPGNGYYANTAMFMSQAAGTGVDDVDPAPGIIATVLARRVKTPTSLGVWSTTKWSDNPAAYTRWLLTSGYYFKLDEAWIDDDSFTEAYLYNDEAVFDTSYSDLIFAPDTASFNAGFTEPEQYLASTGLMSPEYFLLLAGDADPADAMLLPPSAALYTTLTWGEPGEPDPDDPPSGGSTKTLNYFLRRRYTCNVVLSEPMKAVDFLHEIVFLASRQYLTQAPDGRLRLKHRKPVDWALATGSASGTSIAIDNVAPWVADPGNYVLVDPHTSSAEVREVSSAAYSSTAPTLTVSANLSKTNFTGGNGSTTPNTGTITCTSAGSAGTTHTVTLDGIELNATTWAADTVDTVAGFFACSINAHPELRRKFSAAWTAGTDTVTITQRNGTLTLATALGTTHSAPLADPSAAPTISAASGGSFAAGDYKVAYSWVNSRGETLFSPVATVTLTANQKISVSAVTLASGATAVNWYCSPAAGSARLRKVLQNTGGAHTIAELPRVTDQHPPEYNSTGAEVMRISAVFAGAAEARSAATGSNVLKASFRWRFSSRTSPTNQVELKYRDSTQDFRLVTLTLKDEQHIDRIKRTNKKEFNGQAIDNYHQAYRVASAILAESLDADFFYEWASDREALLLEEGDVVAITDRGSNIVNLPVRIESIEFEPDKGFVRAVFAGRKYITTLFDDSVAERQVPVILDESLGVDFV